MLRGQIAPNLSLPTSLSHAFGTIPRHLFLDKSLEPVAYTDKFLPMGKGRVLLSPVLFAKMLCLAGIQPHETVLDVGCCTGYSTAILSSIAKHVIAIESDHHFTSKAHTILRDLHITNSIVIEGNCNMGHPEGKPYDVIFINGVIDSIPGQLLDQLAENGRLVALYADNPSHLGVQHAVLGKALLLTKKKGEINQQECFSTKAYLLQLEESY